MQTWIRASLLDEDCDRRLAVKQWRKRFIQYGFELRELRNHIGAAIGTHSHGTFESQLKFKHSTGQHPSILHGLKESQDKLFEACDQGMEYDTSVTTNRAAAAVQMEGIVREFNSSYLPYVRSAVLNDKPVIEEEFSIYWDSNREVLVTARPDHATSDGEVHDYKTGARKPNQPLQAGLGAIILNHHGFAARKLKTIWLPRNSPTLEEIEYPIEATIEEAEYRVNRLIKNFKEFEEERTPLVFTPNTRSNSCKADYCPAFGTPACPLMEGKNV